MGGTSSKIVFWYLRDDSSARREAGAVLTVFAASDRGVFLNDLASRRSGLALARVRLWIVRHERPRALGDAEGRAPGLAQFRHEEVAVLPFLKVHVEALAARQARRHERRPARLLPERADRVLEGPHRPRGLAAVRDAHLHLRARTMKKKRSSSLRRVDLSARSPRARREVAAAAAHFAASFLARLARARVAAAPLFDELELAALADGRLRCQF